MTNLFMTSKTVKLDVYDTCKYFATAKDFEREIQVTYDAVVGFEVVFGKEAEVIEAESDGSCIDDLHEYLILFFENGDTATFRNSYVDMFVM